MAVPSRATIKRLFAQSGNRCAFPGCTTALVANGVLLGEVCHIRGDKPGSRRFDASQTEQERQGEDNLIILCPTHHTIVDDEKSAYSVDALLKMKRDHEARQTKEYVVSDAMVDRAVLLMTGGIAGYSFGQIEADIEGIVASIGEMLGVRQRGSIPNDLVEQLNWAPRGEIQFLANEQRHKELGVYLADIFKRAGWLVRGHYDLDSFQPNYGINISRNNILILSARVRDRHQSETARQAILQLLARCGFQPRPSDTLVGRPSDALLIGIDIDARR